MAVCIYILNQVHTALFSAPSNFCKFTLGFPFFEQPLFLPFYIIIIKSFSFCKVHVKIDSDGDDNVRMLTGDIFLLHALGNALSYTTDLNLTERIMVD